MTTEITPDALTAAGACRGELLRIDNLSKRFGSTQALDRATLTLRSGEVHGLVGANGSGKSTLVKILAGYHTPDAGTAWLHGATRPLPLSPADRRGIATIHQDLGFVDGLLGRLLCLRQV